MALTNKQCFWAWLIISTLSITSLIIDVIKKEWIKVAFNVVVIIFSILTVITHWKYRNKNNYK